MDFTLWPETELGRWAASLGITVVIFILLKITFNFPIMWFIIIVQALSALVLAMITILKYKEKSILVFLSVVIGIITFFNI
ncbi:hypothetical protein [Aminipila terrae]|uniref:Uncharacterized protein n=1 Tax=Aminipila terrae TaxID=2697030 RepID=A0A6P1MJP5_9FIRM|nr:hypothetical protein [Aminipila terrae]QHI72248.1 hypothetical protein Ami3637_07385 [Aminipila terrae]